MSAADLLSFVDVAAGCRQRDDDQSESATACSLRTSSDQLDALKRDPSMLPRAIEEMLRYDGPVQSTVRFTKEPVQLGGTEIPAGAFAMMIVAAADRDLRNSKS